jgi:hydrogenase maturation protease
VKVVGIVGSIAMTDQITKERTCVIGIGNEYRNDDGIGLLVARRIREQRIPGIAVLELSGEGGGLMSAWNCADTVILVDAVSSGARCGTTYRINARRQTIPSDFFHYSTHAFSVAESIELAKVIGKLPEHCVLFGIEGNDFGMGMTVSQPVQDASDQVVALILNEIDCAKSNRIPVV